MHYLFIIIVEILIRSLAFTYDFTLNILLKKNFLEIFKNILWPEFLLFKKFLFYCVH